jgi:hypothetical protein
MAGRPVIAAFPETESGLEEIATDYDLDHQDAGRK